MLRRILSLVALALLALAVLGVVLLSFRGAQRATHSTDLSLPQAAPAGAAVPTPEPIQAQPGPAAETWQPAGSPAPGAAFVLVASIAIAAVAAFTGVNLFQRTSLPPTAEGGEPAPKRANRSLMWDLLLVMVIAVVLMLVIGALSMNLSGQAAGGGPTSQASATIAQMETQLASNPTRKPTSSIISVTSGAATAATTPTYEITSVGGPFNETPGGSANTTTPEGTATPSGAPAEQVVVEAEWPQRMEVSDSGQVRISLIRAASGAFHVTVESPGNVATSFVVPSPSGATPEASLSGAFGAGYRGSVAATLIGGGFTITPLTATLRSLDGPRSDFVWSIAPEGEAGQKTLLASLDGQWEPVRGQGTTIQRPLWRGSFAVNVTRPLIATGQLDLMTLFSGMLGSVLSVPWLYDRFKSIRQDRKQQSRKRGKPSGESR